ncbi:hypothetical protein HF568_13125 [Acidithiobacillus ferridurans]|uniref:Uncharacterized protein n=1 Tax=Acidithiobacillus ferridurans TaxID=1232575 RepID=A0A8X8GCJ3_ACIFI|nr:hypothetical protein [Acidithiobacillus ferridurans]
MILEQAWSPEQMAGSLCMEHSEAEASNQRISHETMKFFGFRTSAEVMSQHIK